MFYWVLAPLVVGALALEGKTMEKEHARGGGYQDCYECSSKSALCRDSVYDGQYLTRTPCKSACFYRNEDDRIYRGCFDGWMGGVVQHDYLGCRIQNYLGGTVEWCFCNATAGQSEPCNGRHRLTIAGDGGPGRGGRGVEPEPVPNTVVDRMRHSGKSLLVSNYKTQPGQLKEKSQEQSEGTKARQQSRKTVERYEDVSLSGSSKSLSSERDMECYACHDSSPYCQDRVTRPEFVTTTRCRTKCFVRRDNDKTYRGCFDGWVSTSVQHEYTGCRTQYYQSKGVRWCFCDSHLCNSVTIDDIRDFRLQKPEGKKAAPRDDYHTEAPPIVTEERYPPNKSGDHESLLTRASRQPARTIVGMCRGKYDGIYADPYDCTRFVHCFSGFTYRRLCPPGTVWNQRRHNCDYPYTAGVTRCLPRRYVPLPAMYTTTAQRRRRLPTTDSDSWYNTVDDSEDDEEDEGPFRR